MLGYGGSHVHGEITSAAARAACASYAGNVAQHHRGQGMLCDIWNEWNGGLGLSCHYGTAPCNDTVMYTDLLCRAYHAIKAADPDARVLGGVTSGVDRAFVRGTLAAGTAACMDGISVHPYAGLTASPPYQYTPSLVAASITRLTGLNRDVVAAVGHSLPVYATEDSIPSAPEYHNTPDDQAHYLTEMYTAVGALPFMRGLWWYELVDDGRVPYSALENYYGLTLNDLMPKPAYVAFQAQAAHTARAPPATAE